MNIHLALKAAKVGDWARIDAPYGQFTFEGESPKIALLAGGIGITPFMSISKMQRTNIWIRKLLFFTDVALKEILHLEKNLKPCKNKTRI